MLKPVLFFIVSYAIGVDGQKWITSIVSFSPYPRAKSPRLDLLWLIVGELRQTSDSTVNSTQFSNSSLNLTSSDVDLNFIRPPINPVTECNLWGPLCQTGTITVDVNLTSTTIKTTVPCSVYLSAQATSAQQQHSLHADDDLSEPNGYDISFGRSPECTSYAHHAQNGIPLTFSACGPNASETIGTLPPADDWFFSPDLPGEFQKNLPFGIASNISPNMNLYCCGSCFMALNEIRVLYFPDESIRTCSQSDWDKTSDYNTTNSITFNAHDFHKRAHSLLVGNGSSIAVLDGYTMTSPSFYLQIIGTAQVWDDCGRVGPVRTNEIVPVRSEDLSSVSFELPIGSSTFDLLNLPFAPIEHQKQVKVADLMCPTWGVNGNCAPNEDCIYTMGPPFNPIIYPPPNLLYLDPAWSNCDYSHSMALGRLALPINAVFDPPHILTPVAGLFPTPTPPFAPTQSDSETSAKPADVGHSKLPAITPPPSVVDPDRESPGNSGHGDGAHSAHDKPGPGQNSRPRPVSNLPSPVKAPPASAPRADPENQAPRVKPTQDDSPVNPSTHKAPPGDRIHKDPLVGPAHKAPPASALPSDSEHQKTVTSANPKHSPPKAPINDLPIGGNDPSPDDTTPPSDPEPRPKIPENDKHQDDPGLGAIIFSAFGGRPNSGASSAKSFKHDAFIGASTIALPTSKSAIITAANQLVTIVNPSAVAIGGTILSVAGNPAILPGPVFSLGKSGKIQIGTTTMDLPNSPGVLTVQGHLITIDSQSAVMVVGSTLLPGGKPITLPNQILSLAHSGRLFLNSLADSDLISAAESPPSVLQGGGFIVTADSSGYLVAGQTIKPGAPVTISGKTIAWAPSNDLVVGKSTIALSPPSPVFTVAGQVFTPASKGFAVGGKTLLPGGASVTISGVPISLGLSGNIVVGSSTVSLPKIFTPLPSTTFTFDDQVFTAVPSGLAIDGTTLVPGGDGITTNGVPISLGSSGNIVLGSSTISLPRVFTPLPSSTFTFGNQVFTAVPSGLAIEGTTLIPGGAGITINGAPINLDPSGKIVVGSSTISLPKIFTTLPFSTFTFDNQVFTAVPSGLALDGTTLVPGGLSITINGVPINLGPSGKIVVGSSTTFLPNIFPDPSNPSSPITISNPVFTLLPSGLAIDGTTLTPGGPDITVAGTHLSLDPDGNLIVKNNNVATTSVSLSSSSSSLEVLTSGASVSPTGSEEATRTSGVGFLGGQLRSTMFKGGFWFSAVFASISTGILW